MGLGFCMLIPSKICIKGIHVEEKHLITPVSFFLETPQKSSTKCSLLPPPFTISHGRTVIFYVDTHFASHHQIILQKR